MNGAFLDYPKARFTRRGGKKVDSSNVESVSKAKNRFYALQSKGDQETSPYVPFRYVSILWFINISRISFDYYMIFRF